MSPRTYALLQRAGELELDFCIRVNNSFRAPLIQKFFAAISRLGDGIFWYTLMLSLPFIYGMAALKVTGLMIAIGVIDLLLYKLIKHLTGRERPCAVNEKICLGTPPLDHYSFPSGHTLHAVAFTIIAVFHFPELAIVLIPFATLVAASRVILGLHYPTDVAAGAALGSGVASLALYLS